jgi:hypothetical protein
MTNLKKGASLLSVAAIVLYAMTATLREGWATRQTGNSVRGLPGRS